MAWAKVVKNQISSVWIPFYFCLAICGDTGFGLRLPKQSESIFVALKVRDFSRHLLCVGGVTLSSRTISRAYRRYIA